MSKLEKYKHYKKYIIPRIENVNDVQRISYDILNLLSSNDGLLISTQYNKIRETENIIAKFCHLGIKEKVRVDTKDKNDSTGDFIDVLVIVIEKIPQIRF